MNQPVSELMRLYFVEDDESFGVEDVDIAAFCTDHQAADAILISRALLQSPDAGDDRLKEQCLAQLGDCALK